MEVHKKYHFYAAHRNETLEDKCSNIHGHTYYVKVELNFPTPKPEEVTMLFSDIDTKVEPLIKDLDHGMMINVFDPLHAYLCKFQNETGQDLKLIEFNAPTSVENLCVSLFNKIKKTGLPIFAIEIQETTTSTIRYYGV